ncbi:MAG TPA: divalent-cation tolerance protein CutA [Acidimicrobiales bacterium]|nr:divalent-cation tolerance protein CutA [Acidimicrobiales bacterium]
MAEPAIIQITTATGSFGEADALAALLLDRRLAACVQVAGPVRSRYWWQGAQESATEWLCVVKTTAELADGAIAAIAAAHSYEVPEVVATPVVAGHPAYLAWVAAQATGEPASLSPMTPTHDTLTDDTSTDDTSTDDASRETS